MNPKNLLNEASALIDDRGGDYGGIEDNFENIAVIANTILGRDLSAYDVAIILASVKIARIRMSPTKRDNYVDGVNYLAFAGEMAAPAAAVEEPKLADWPARRKPLSAVVTDAEIVPQRDFG